MVVGSFVDSPKLDRRHLFFVISGSLIPGLLFSGFRGAMPAFIFEQANIITYTIGVISFYLGYGGFMTASLQIPLTMKGISGWLLQGLAYIGKHPYPIYVFHLPIINQLQKRQSVVERLARTGPILRQ